MGAILNKIWGYWPGSSEPSFPHVETQVRYYKPSAIHQHEKPYVCEFSVEAVSDAERTNIDYEERGVVVSDIRGHEQRFSLERNGFEIVHHQSSLTHDDFESRTEVEARYFAECEEMARSRFNASEAIVFNWTVSDTTTTGFQVISLT
jgi:hypothetical protein